METETIKIEITLDKIQAAVEKGIDAILKSEYDNPVRKSLESILKEKQSEFNTVISSIISERIQSPEFKSQIGDVLLTKMIESALRK